MGSSKQLHSNQLTLSAQDIRDLAEEISKILVRDLPRMGNSRKSTLANEGSSGVQMDETLIDVGISTAGISNASESPIGTETISEDSVTAATDKLKSLKKKG